MFQKFLQGTYEILTKYLINIIFGAVILFYLVSCVFFVLSNSGKHLWLVLLAFLIYGIFSYIIIFGTLRILNRFSSINNFINARTLSIAIFIGSLLVYTIWNLIVNTQPVSDYTVLINGATEILGGNFQNATFDPSNYFYFYNYQVGFALYLAGIMCVVGKSLWGLKIVEIIILSISNVIVFMVAKIMIEKLTNKPVSNEHVASMKDSVARNTEKKVNENFILKSAALTAVFYGGLLFNIAGSGIINNQHVATLFILLATLLYLKSDGTGKISFTVELREEKGRKNIGLRICCGACLALSYLLRPSTIIFIVAIACLELIKFLRNNSRGWKKSAVNFLFIIIPLISVIQAYDLILKSINFVPNSAVSSNATHYKFVLGIQNEGITGSKTVDAEKSLVYYDLKAFDFNYQEYNEATKTFLKSRYSDDTKTIIGFIINKMLYFSGHPDNQIDFALNGENRKIGALMRYGGYAQYLWLILLASAIIITRDAKRCCRKKNIQQNTDKMDEDSILLLKIAFIGYFLCHLFIEAQTRYRYEQYLLLTLLVAPSLIRLISRRHQASISDIL